MFQYDQAIVARFPQTVGGVIYATGLRNHVVSAELETLYVAEQQQTIARIGDTSLGDIPSLKAWRGVFSAFGLNPTKTRSAPEALLRRLTKKGDIPSINPLVDMGNLISIRYALPIAIFDTCDLTGTLTVKFADGSERYTELGSVDSDHPEIGEVVFADDRGLVFARRWCWRQSHQSAAQNSTEDVLITIEGQHDNGHHDVEQAMNDLLELLDKFVGGQYQYALLDKQDTHFTPDT
ncbi:MAG: hypothetical protein KC615_12380 [Anaerolineae bacterium]|nr:hypothetical protein [Anaerolineae bacterium]